MINGEGWALLGSSYLILLNVIGFLSMGIDKYRARTYQWRVPEKTLFLIAILGGSIGSLGGMYLFRHKTNHRSFIYGLPFIICCQAGIVWFVKSI